MIRLFFVLLLLQGLCAPPLYAKPTCLDAEGDGVLVGEDVAAAKAEAVTRAKWAAIEEAVGVDVKAHSVVQNLMMVDEAISKEMRGVVTGYKVLSQKVAADTVTVRINACVEASRATEAVAGLALNNAVSVLILARNPAAGGSGPYEESNAVSEAVIDALAGQGYKVTDLASTQALQQGAVDAVLKGGKLAELRSLMHKFLSNVLLVGKIEYTHSTKKGEDVGYGIASPFDKVSARLTYRLVSKDASGRMVILAAGSEQGAGMAGTVADAAAAALKKLAERVTPQMNEKAGLHVKNAARTVVVSAQGVKELGENFALKEMLQGLAWVTEVKEKELGVFGVTYAENPIYLANSISQKGGWQLAGFTPETIVLKRK